MSTGECSIAGPKTVYIDSVLRERNDCMNSIITALATRILSKEKNAGGNAHLGGFLETGMHSEPKVVARAEVEIRFSINLEVSTLTRVDDTRNGFLRLPRAEPAPHLFGRCHS